MNIIYGELNTYGKSVRLNGDTIYHGYRNPSNFRYLPQFSFIPKSLRVQRVFKDFELDFSQFQHYFPTFEKYYKTKFHCLSGGERRIIEIYCILASKTKFCMLDEPFSQIMPVHLEIIKSILKDEKKNKGIIITDHLYDHVCEICDDLYVIANGKTYLTNEIGDLKKLGYTSK
jgi:ABC-type lipopolysaccharide export system ATPase subunit